MEVIVADAAEGVFEDEERVVGAMMVLGEVLSGPQKKDGVAQFFVVIDQRGLGISDAYKLVSSMLLPGRTRLPASSGQKSESSPTTML